MNKTYLSFAAAALSVGPLFALDVSFTARTEPAVTGVTATVDARASGNEWEIAVTVTNATDRTVRLKAVLSAEPRLVATRYMIPGVNYNGNEYGERMPKGWEKDGEPWIFGYDRCSIPSCTVSENAETVFALFASDADPDSHVSSCSMEKQADGSFRHLVYWPVTEAPVSYTDKKTFSERYDTYLTLAPGAAFRAKAFACTGKPPWPNYGFETVFRCAWKRLVHAMPAARTVSETMRLDKAFQDWSRRQDDEGFWYYGFLVDQTLLLGNHRVNAPTNVTIADIEMDPSRNWWNTPDLEESKHLKKGEYVRGPGQDIGFSAQSFQMARLSIEYGLRNGRREDVDFGLKVLRSWIRVRQRPSGHFMHPGHPDWKKTNASTVGWAIGELARVAILLKSHGMDASDFEAAAAKLVKSVVGNVRKDGNLGSRWVIESGETIGWGGDCGGYVLMGLVRYWQLTRDPKLMETIEKAFIYYYNHDVNKFACNGGAMDCVSVDREGIHPFFTAAVTMHRETGRIRYLKWAKQAAWYFLSWLYLQNPVYGPETDFAKFNFRPAGATIVGCEHPALDDYGSVMIADLFALYHITGDGLWRDVAAFMWRNATQGFADEKHRVWHALERPLGAKNEAYFQTRWSKYRTGERKRGHFNDLCSAWGGTYRLASIYDLSPEDLLWLEAHCRPSNR